ncbi:dTDP-4-dehydrorhamnose reductase [Blastopirellula marina]|uniref:dTDP-4-dehydrorhamnose reductase n=1 Tax=Blastopirellula marina TaxID=124 RepID=A0A2S8GHK8_9BACT|nr:dTDP-4-dehydrorhamnose reductase [Blastopirellula marina]PQO43907.1 dTDP-4-dehydrorhamnose reductase [Blastopirellula marina]
MIKSDAPILVTGAAGQLGKTFVRMLGDQAIGCDRAEFDLSSPDSILAAVRRYRPQIVINCGAYTAVDKAETEPELCETINAAAVAAFAQACEEQDAVLVQISTDYVFGAQPEVPTPWQESDATAPQGQYAKSKLHGEQAAAAAPKHLIVRTCGLYGGGPNHVSFVEKMLQLGEQRTHLRVVDDQRCTPSLVDDVAAAVLQLLESDSRGLFHVVNDGETTWNEFAQEIFRIVGYEVQVDPISTAEFNAPAPRPSYSVLDTAKFQTLGKGPLPHWKDALSRYLTTLRPILAEGLQTS